jgi:predicted DNA-binding protein
MYNSYIVKRTQIYLEEEQDRRLSDRAAQSGRTKSDLIREAVDQYLNGPSDQAARVERFREAVRKVAGIAPYLPSGKKYVEELRKHDRRRQRELERRWRGR